MTKVTKRVLILLLALVGTLSLALFGGCKNSPSGSGSSGSSYSSSDDISSSNSSGMEIQDPSTCDHSNINKEEISVDDCNRRDLLICTDCGSVVGEETVVRHTWSEGVVYLARKSCLIGARTAIVCTVCGAEREDTVTFSAKEDDGECYAEHLEVTTIFYTFDENNTANPTEVQNNHHVKVCVVCGETVERLNHNWTCDKDGIILTSVDSKEYTFRLKCNHDLCNATKEIKGTANVLTVEPTCTKNGYVAYTDITDKDGNVLMDPVKKDEALIVKISETPALGHNHKDLGVIGCDTVFDIRVYEGKFEELDDVVCGSTVVNAVDGYYVCDRAGCGCSVKVKLYKSHTGNRMVTTEATCTTAGAIEFIEACTDCGWGPGSIMFVPALGHDYIYTVTGSKEKGDLEVYYDCTREGCNSRGKLTDVDDVEITAKSYCKRNGSAVIKFVESANRDDLTVRLAVSGHILHGKEMHTFDDGTHTVYSYPLDGVKLFREDKFTTCKDEVSTIPNAFFMCDFCANYYQIFVKKDHVWAYDESATKDATCEEKGYVRARCLACAEATLDQSIPALGHDVEWKLVEVNGLKATVAIRCKRADCKMGTSFDKILADTTTYSDNVAEFDLSKYFSFVEGNVKVETKAAKADGFIIDTEVAGTCATEGVYKVTLIIPDDDNYVISSDITFEVTCVAAHVTVGSTITWVLGGVKYTGKYCKVCGNVVVTDVDNKY